MSQTIVKWLRNYRDIHGIRNVDIRTITGWTSKTTRRKFTAETRLLFDDFLLLTEVLANLSGVTPQGLRKECLEETDLIDSPISS